MRPLFLALCAVVASSAVASTQAPWSPSPLAPPAIQRETISPVALAGGSAAAGCAGCGVSTAASPGPLAGLHARVASSPLTIGQGCANSPNCGSFASERTFLFGSCRQFFNAGNKCGGGCGGGNGSIGGFGDGSPCKYGSYLNR